MKKTVWFVIGREMIVIEIEMGIKVDSRSLHFGIRKEKRERRRKNNGKRYKNNS